MLREKQQCRERRYEVLKKKVEIVDKVSIGGEFEKSPGRNDKFSWESLREEHSRQRKFQMQKPLGGDLLNILGREETNLVLSGEND